MSPRKIIECQLEAYNNRDLENFIKLFAQNASTYDLKSGERVMEGIDQLRERYTERFDNSPNLHSTLLNRIVLGDIVIDDEDISGFGSDNNVRLIAIYEVKNNFITRMWFARGEEKPEIVRPVNLQLDACNSLNLDAFTSAFHPDIVLYDLQSGKESLRGHKAMRVRYSKSFEDSPNLKAELVQRILLDQFVIDLESITGFHGDQKINVIAINEVADGLITKVRFVIE